MAKKRSRKFYSELRRWGIALVGAGALTVAVPFVTEAPVSAGEQCDAATNVIAVYEDNETLSKAEQKVYDDALREVDECMK